MGFELDAQQIKDYETKDVDYKDEARTMLCEGLGYAPPLNVSVLSEIVLRGALKRYSLGENSKRSLDDLLDFQVTFINRLMMERVDSCNC